MAGVRKWTKAESVWGGGERDTEFVTHTATCGWKCPVRTGTHTSREHPLLHPREMGKTASWDLAFITIINRFVERYFLLSSRLTVLMSLMVEVLLYVHRNSRFIRDVHLDFHTAPELCAHVECDSPFSL